jgi:hypothetical protein
MNNPKELEFRTFYVCFYTSNLLALLAALNTGKVKPDDMFDSGVGIFVYDNDTIYDHNW